jgi:hypothetical protein
MAKRRRDDERPAFVGVSATEISVPLLLEEVEKARELIEANNWGEEGYHIIFSNGLAYLRGEARLQTIAANGAPAGELERITRELIDMHSQYAVMKFRAFMLDQARQTMEMNITGLKAENRWDGVRLRQFREDEERMGARIKYLEAETEALRMRIAILEGDAEPPAANKGGGLRGVVRRLRRK